MVMVIKSRSQNMVKFKAFENICFTETLLLSFDVTRHICHSDLASFSSMYLQTSKVLSRSSRTL